MFVYVPSVHLVVAVAQPEGQVVLNFAVAVRLVEQDQFRGIANVVHLQHMSMLLYRPRILFILLSICHDLSELVPVFEPDSEVLEVT